MTALDRLERLLALARRAAAFHREMLTVVAVGLVVSAAVAGLRPRVYRSQTLIQYREGIRSSAVAGGEPGADSAHRLGLELREMALSRNRLLAMIRDLRLYPAIVATRGEVDAVEEMRSHIRFAIRDGEVYDLSFDADDPRRAKAVTERLAAELVAEHDQRRAEQASVTRDFLDQELRHNEQELQRRESALAQFLAQHPELAAAGAAEVGHAVRAELGGGFIDAGSVVLARGRRDRARGAVGPAAGGAELQAARRDLAEKLARFTDQHPDVRAAAAKVKALELKAGSSGAIAPRDPPPRPDPGPPKESARGGEVAARPSGAGRPASTPAAARVVALEAEWARLSREVDDARARRQELDAKQFRAMITASSVSSDKNPQLVVVDPAYLPLHPAPPSPLLLLAVGLLLSLIAAAATGVGRALLDDRLHDRSDLERIGAPRLLAVVPRVPAGALPEPPPAAATRTRRATMQWMPRARHDTVVDGVPIWTEPLAPAAESRQARLFLRRAPDSPQAAAFRVLRHRLLREGDPRIIAVASGGDGDGKSTCAANLALALAEGGRARVLLIEANLRHPSLAALFEVIPSACFARQVEHHRGNPLAPWSVVELPPGSLHLALLKPDDPDRPPLDGPSLCTAVSSLRRAGYDYLVIDAPPVLESRDIHPIEEAADGVLLVAWAGRSSARALRLTVEQLTPNKILGLGLLHA